MMPALTPRLPAVAFGVISPLPQQIRIIGAIIAYGLVTPSNARLTMVEPAGIRTKQPIAIRPSMPSRCVSRFDRKLPTRNPIGGSAA